MQKLAIDSIRNSAWGGVCRDPQYYSWSMQEQVNARSPTNKTWLAPKAGTMWVKIGSLKLSSWLLLVSFSFSLLSNILYMHIIKHQHTYTYTYIYVYYPDCLTFCLVYCLLSVVDRLLPVALAWSNADGRELTFSSIRNWANRTEGLRLRVDDQHGVSTRSLSLYLRKYISIYTPYGGALYD